MSKILRKTLILLICCICSQFTGAQGTADNSIRGKVYSDMDPGLVGVNVVEVDATNRILMATMTDINGNFSMRLKNPSNKLRISYVGFKTLLLNIGNTRTFKIKLDDATTIATVQVQGRKMTNTGTLNIPKREVSIAMQTISSKEFEGLSVTSVDDALQGRISGLDIVANSGDVGAGSSMRIRGITSINSSSQPLIVVNGIIYDTPSSSEFDYATANREQFASLLSVNVDDIEDISVLKDAAATAVWGSRGANGVLSITTKKGAIGKTKLQYSYRFSGAVQPQGMSMLTGDDYTMLMKEAYFNPRQSDAASNIREFNYDRTFTEYENYNNNTDWVREVTQFGSTHDHYLQLSGGGERARFLVSAGYYNQTGSVIKQNFERYTNRVNLDYNVSDRIKVSTEFSFTNSVNDENHDPNKNNGSLLGIAYRIMPNMSVYAQDPVTGTNTGAYYKMLKSSSPQLSDQKALYNPVALANLAVKRSESLRVLPTFRIQYDLLDPQKQMLRFKSYVALDINNSNKYSFLPKELSTATWDDGGINSAYSEDKRSFAVTSDNNLSWMPKFSSKDHSLLLYGSYQFGVSSSKDQKVSSFGAPNGITGSTSGGYVSSFETYPSQSRWMAYMGMAHYVFKDRYVADITVRRDGSTKFGDDRKWGTFPGISFAWNIADEPFLAKQKKWLSTMKFRPSWGITGNQPGSEYLFYSLYSAYKSYLGVSTIRPSNVQLTNLRWEKVSSVNYGLDLGFFEDAYTIDFNYYYKKTEDMLFKDIAISSTSGYGKLAYKNAGTMKNDGWDVNMQANKLIKAGAFNMSFTLNLSNYINTIVELDQSIMDSYNNAFNYNNGAYLTRIQANNSFGSIYGFKYKGVYQYNDYKAGREGKCPYALDVDGKVIRDANGDPLKMTFAAGTTSQYAFKGGDAIYEDINHDGTINELDIVYLGNSNPLFNGGFGIKLNYKRLSANIFSNFRVGNKIVNFARMHAENMYNNSNQAASVNWRWRKDGDVTSIPRALYLSGYNWLGSDRYVEDGSFWRVKYLQVNYALDSKKLKALNINQLSLYLTVNNLVSFTKYSGVDAEVDYNVTKYKGISVDESQTPRSRSFTAGMTVVF